MPMIQLRFFSQRDRAITDPVLPDQFEITGTHFVHPADIDPAPGGLDANLVPGHYTCQLWLDGFKSGKFALHAASSPKTKTVKTRVDHRCTLLPDLAQFDAEQQRLFSSFVNKGSDSKEWNALSDNQACTFFQVTYALARTPLNGNGALSGVIQRVQRIGGSLITGLVPGGTRCATGWRLHVLIKPAHRDSIAAQLKANGFKRDDGPTHSTHTRFGYTRSFRQQGAQPLLQIVFNDDFSGADVDLDRGVFHKSAPHNVYKAMKKKFPGVEEIYKVS
jgi:hypothetical protein